MNARGAGWLPALLVGLAGCGGFTPTGPPGPHSAGPVFLVNGVWPDDETWWIDDVAQALRAEGLDPIPVPYTTFVFGYLFGWGTDPPADRLARFAQEAAGQHARTGCATPLRWNGIGYSAGTMVLTKAADRGVRFERVYFAGSPIPFYSGFLRAQLASGRMGRVINYFSPLDMVVWATCGMGMCGYHGGGPHHQRLVENRLHWWPHVTPLWYSDAVIRQVAAELAGSRREAPHTCFRVPWFRAWYDNAKAGLLAGG